MAYSDGPLRPMATLRNALQRHLSTFWSYALPPRFAFARLHAFGWDAAAALCNELQQDAGGGEKPVRTSVRAAAVYTGDIGLLGGRFALPDASAWLHD